MASKDEVKQQYRELINEDAHKNRSLNYVVALSSALPVTQEIPSEIHKRAAWASNNGASFIELSLGGPSVVYNEWDDLLSISRQLGLSFDAHFPVKVPFDYSNPYREQSEQMGFFYSHEFMYKFIEAWGDFKQALESQEDSHGRQQHVYGINAHLVKSTVPDREERMNRGISVGPFGYKIWKSKMFSVPEFRVGFFEHYMWEKELKHNQDQIQNIADNMEGLTDFNEMQKKVFAELLEEEEYLDDELLEAVSKIGEEEEVRETVEWRIKNDNKYDIGIADAQLEQVLLPFFAEEEGLPSPQQLQRQLAQEMDQQIPLSYEGLSSQYVSDLANGQVQTQMGTIDLPIGGIVDTAQQVLDRLEGVLESDLGEEIDNLDQETKERLIDAKVEMLLGRGASMTIRQANRNIAGTDADIPREMDDVVNHPEGLQILTSIPRFDPEVYRESEWADLIPVEVWERDEDKHLRDQADYSSFVDEAQYMLFQQVKDRVVEELEKEETYDGYREYLDADEQPRPLSKGEVTFRDIMNFGGGRYRNFLSEESTIFWGVMPWWMPFSGIDQVEYIFEEITGLDPDEYSMDNLQQLKEDLDEIGESDDYDRIAAAGAGAYVWGHFTQFVGRGQDRTLVEHLDEKGLSMDWESHNVGAGQQGRGRLWKPHDIIKVCRAINDTPAGAYNDTDDYGDGQQHDVMRCTIDMEHLARNGVDPLWVIEGSDEHGYRGLDDGDGKLISKQHVTHPALDEQQHHHMPIRRGDTLVYRHIEALVDKGFCQREDRPCVVMHELGAEKAESTFMLRLILNMLEYGISSEELESSYVDDAWNRFEEGEDVSLKDYMVLKFFGLTDEEWHHEWQEVFEHALDPLNGLLESASPDEVWSGQRAFQQGARPEDWEEEKYR